MKRTGLVLIYSFLLASCSYPKLHFVPATLAFEEGSIPRKILEAPQYQLGTLTNDPEWRANADYTGQNDNGFLIREISVVDFRTVQFFISDTSSIVELRITYAPFRVDPDKVISELTYKMNEPPSTRTVTRPSQLRITPLPPPSRIHYATWQDEKTVLEVVHNVNQGGIIVKLIDINAGESK